MTLWEMEGRKEISNISLLLTGSSTKYVHRNEDAKTEESLGRGLGPSDLFLREEYWAVPLIATAAANIASILAFEIYVIVRAFHSTPSRRHLFLGQCLLLGLIMTSLTGLPFALQPSPFACAAARLLVGAAPALVFGTLLVKCVFLISLNSGVYLPAHYQGLLLFFVFLVQVVISVQWLSTFPSEVRLVSDLFDEKVLECKTTYKHYMLSLLYVMSLIITVAAFSLKCRGIRENYRESSHIGASMCIILPMWLLWTLTGFILPQRLQPACLGFGSVLSGTVVFLVMFIPKGRQMAAFGKDGFYTEDRGDGLSTLSSTRHSPSFFLFQPVKASKDTLRSANNNSSTCKTDISGSCVSRTDEGIYSSVEPYSEFKAPSNPNFYLFRSHSNIGMMY